MSHPPRNERLERQLQDTRLSRLQGAGYLHDIMKHQPPSLELDTLAAELAAIIDAQAGDYPLVAFRQEAPGPDLTWMYAHLVVEVFVVKTRPASIRSREQGGIELDVESLQQGMDLLRRTEGLRQNRDWPYVQLG